MMIRNPQVISQPPILGAAAVICYAVCMFLYPWRACCGRGWRFAREHPWTWVILGAVGAHQGWWLARQAPVIWQWTANFTPAFANELIPTAAGATVDSVSATLLWPCVGEPLSVILALAMFFNLGDIGIALRRGCRTAFVRFADGWFALLVLSAACNVAWLTLKIGAWLPENGWELRTIHAAGLLWTGATVAFALGWLVRLSETYFQAPEELLQIDWTSSAAARIPRLWPVVLVVAGMQALQEAGMPLPWRQSLGAGLTIAGATLPLVLVHWRGDWGWRAAFQGAGQRWIAQLLPLIGWLLLAMTHFFLFHLAHLGIASGLPAGSGVRLGWDFLMALLHAGLVVWLLATWVAHQPAFEEGMERAVKKPGKNQPTSNS